jgi:hypothetical protein
MLAEAQEPLGLRRVGRRESAGSAVLGAGTRRASSVSERVQEKRVAAGGAHYRVIANQPGVVTSPLATLHRIDSQGAAEGV